MLNNFAYMHYSTRGQALSLLEPGIERIAVTLRLHVLMPIGFGSLYNPDFEAA